jgi:MFS family permease
MQHARNGSPPAGWIALGILWMVCLLNYADRQAISSIFPVLERDLGFGKAQIGLIGGAFMWIYAICSPFAGMAGDFMGRKGRKGLIVAGCLFWSLMTGWTGGCSRLWQFLSVRSLVGLGESLYFPSATSLISSWHRRGTRSTALSLHQSAVYFGTILGGWLGALLAELLGWRMMFWCFAAAGAVLSLGALLFLRTPDDSECGEVPPRCGKESSVRGMACWWRMISSPHLLCLMGAFVMANGVSSIFLIWAPTYLLERFHLGLVAAGTTAVVWIQISSALSAPVSGWIADRLSPVLPGARIAVQGAGLIAGALCVFLLGRAEGLTGVILCMVCFGSCKGFYDGGIFASLFDHVPESQRATSAGIMNFVGWGGGALGPVLLGFAAQGGGTDRMAVAISWSAVAYLAGALLLGGAFWMAGKRNENS